MIPIGILGGPEGQALYHQLLSDDIDAADVALYTSKNLHESRGPFGTLYIAYMPLEMRTSSAQDKATLDELLEALDKVEANQVVLISTIDVLESGNENSTAWSTHAFGQHRRELEEWVRARWPAVIVRLANVFGPDINGRLYDIQPHNPDQISMDSAYQWYNVSHLLEDCYRCLKHGIRLAHFCSPPIPMRDIPELFLPECHGTKRIQNIQTMNGGTLEGHYTCTRKHVLIEMATISRNGVGSLPGRSN